MPKLPDLIELSKKFDLQGFLDSVKSAVGATPPPLKAPEGDEVATQFVELIALAQQLAKVQAEQAKTIAMLHTKLNELYKNMQALKENAGMAPASPSTVADTSTTLVENSDLISANPTGEDEEKKEN